MVGKSGGTGLRGIVKVSQLTEEEVKAGVVCMLAYDASRAAHMAYDLLFGDMMKRIPSTKAVVYHAYDANNDTQRNLSYKMKKSTIKSALENLTFTVGSDRVESIILPIRDSCVGRQITLAAHQYTADTETVDFLVMGCSGSKGEAVELMGSDVAYALQNSEMSCILIKRSGNVEEFSRQILVPMDLTPEAEKGLVDAIFLATEDTTIHILHILRVNDDKDKNKEHLESLIEAAKKLTKAQIKLVMQNSEGEGVADMILKYIVDEDMDMVFLGALRQRDDSDTKSGAAFKYCGSVSFQILVETRVPVCIAHHNKEFELNDPVMRQHRMQKEAYRPPVILPDPSAMMATPGPAYSAENKYRTGGVGDTGIKPAYAQRELSDMRSRFADEVDACDDLLSRGKPKTTDSYAMKNISAIVDLTKK